MEDFTIDAVDRSGCVIPCQWPRVDHSCLNDFFDLLLGRQFDRDDFGSDKRFLFENDPVDIELQ